jgi:CheY-like chemotaxis protein
MFAIGAILVGLGIYLLQLSSHAAAFMATLILVSGGQMVLATIGIQSQLLGTVPSLPDSRRRAALEDGDIRQTISANIALALGALKYAAEHPQTASAKDEMRDRLSAATTVVLENAGRISFERYAELYLPFLEKSAALRAQSVDSLQAITVLQEFQERFGFPNLEYDSRLSAPSVEPYHSSALTDLEILVLDDDPSILRIAQLFLSRSGASVSTAADSDAALSMIAQNRPDLVLTDLVLGEKSGHEFLRRLRQSDERLPVVALSSYKPSITQLAEEGFDSFISKPLSQESLTKTLAALPAVSKVMIRKRENLH